MEKRTTLNREQLRMFKQNHENRLINHGHKKKIKKEMVDSLAYFPEITVNAKTNHIIDGQHRWAAFIELVDEGLLPSNATLDVKYLDIDETNEKEAIINANVVSKNWSLDDYITSSSKTNEHYKQLTDWCQSHTLTTDGNKHKYRYGAAMLTGKNCSKELKNGTFLLTKENIEIGNIIHDELIDILEILGKKMANPFMEALAISWSEVRSQYPYSVWRKEIKAKKNVLIKKPSENQKEWNDIFALILRAIVLKKGNVTPA